MGSRKQIERRKRQAEASRRQKQRLRNPAGWHPPPPPEASWLGLEPAAAPDEPVEDIAVFDDAALATLSPETRAEAEIVREALELAAAGEPQTALDRLTPIGRRSGYADWRLFLRGLASFQSGDLPSGRDAWNRLAANRRPARIAAVLAAAWEEVHKAPNASQQWAAGDGPQAAATAILSRGSLWAAAREIAAIRHRDEERRFSASQAALAIRLEKQYREIDPDFTRDFSLACRLLAMAQHDEEPLRVLCRGTAGPPDDPHSLRLLFSYLRMIDAEPSDLSKCIRDYIDRDLDGGIPLPAGLRAALASTGLYLTAESFLEEGSMGPFGFLSRSDDELCERLLREAIERFPRNPRAHEALVQLLKDRIDRKRSHRAAERAFVAAKTAFVEQFPDRHEHILELVDHLLEKDDFEQAEPLVRLLADQRCTDLAARATPWRFELVRASRMAAKAGGLPQARSSLAAAIEAWPPWMSRHWIPWLEATLLLREAAEADHAAAVAAARQAVPHRLFADVLEYEAVVQLAGPPSAVKKLSTRVRTAAKQSASEAAVVPLAAVGCFYLDLEQSGIDLMVGADHPARAIGRALVARLGRQGKAAPGTDGGAAADLPVDDPAFRAAFRWLAKHDFFGGVNPKREPRGFAQLADTHPWAAAEVLGWLASAAPDALTSRRSRKRMAIVEEFLPAEPNPAARERFAAIVARARRAAEDARQRRRQARRDARHGSPFDFEPPLPARFGSSADLPPLLRLILDRGGPAAVAKLAPLLMGPQSQATADRITRLCAEIDISPAELVAAVIATETELSN